MAALFIRAPMLPPATRGPTMATTALTMAETSSSAGTVMEGTMAIITSPGVVLDAKVFQAAAVAREARMAGVDLTTEAGADMKEGTEVGVDVSVS